MENYPLTNTSDALEAINAISQMLIQESYLAGACRSVWILGHDDDDSDMN